MNCMSVLTFMELLAKASLKKRAKCPSHIILARGAVGTFPFPQAVQYLYIQEICEAWPSSDLMPQQQLCINPNKTYI